jgi:hypothetical protein
MSLAAAEPRAAAFARRGPAVRDLLAATVASALVLVYSFRSGGYPIGLPAAGAALLCLLFAARALLWPETIRPLRGAALLVSLGLAALALLAVASMAWSHAPARAVPECCRYLLYLSAFVTLATLPSVSLAVVTRGIAGAIALVALVALATRCFPTLFPLPTDVAMPRLSFPLDYQNALGILMATGLILCLALTSEVEEPLLVRVLAAAAVPAIATALYLAQSRGALGASVLGLAVWALAGRPRGLPATLLAVGPPTLVALVVAYDAVGLVGYQWMDATNDGMLVAGVLMLSTAACLALRMWTFRLDERIAELQRPRPSRTALAAVIATVLVVGAAGAVAVHLPSRLHSAAQSFVNDTPTSPITDPRARLTQVFNGGRLDLWRGAMQAARGQLVLGIGAGTFESAWARVRGDYTELTEAHSLYIETLAELGIAGLSLIVVTLIAAGGALLGSPGSRNLRLAALAVTAAWAAHAALDWDWEMPAVTLPVFLLVGAATARPGAGASLRPRAGLVLAFLALAVAALPAAWSITQASEDAALRAYAHGDCGGALSAADHALALDFRPDAQVVRAACLARAHQPAAALAAAHRAAELDPGDWRYTYDAALVETATGDTRSAYATALAAMRISKLTHEAYWLAYWVRPGSPRPAARTAALATPLIAGDRYPPISPGLAVTG